MIGGDGLVDQAALLEWAKEEQVDLWGRLVDAIDRAINGVWSIEAESIAGSIVRCARIIGATPPTAISWDLVTSGLYEAILTGGNVVVVMPSAEDRQGIDKLMKAYQLPQRVARYGEAARKVRDLHPDWWED